MASVILSEEMRRYTSGETRIEVSAQSYRELLKELSARYPDLPGDLVRRQGLGINGVLIPEPLLESFSADAELVFVARIQGG